MVSFHSAPTYQIQSVATSDRNDSIRFDIMIVRILHGSPRFSQIKRMRKQWLPGPSFSGRLGLGTKVAKDVINVVINNDKINTKFQNFLTY